MYVIDFINNNSKYVQKFCPLDVYIIPEYSDIKSKICKFNHRMEWGDIREGGSI